MWLTQIAEVIIRDMCDGVYKMDTLYIRYRGIFNTCIHNLAVLLHLRTVLKVVCKLKLNETWTIFTILLFMFLWLNSRDTVQIPLCLRCSFSCQIFGITKIYLWPSYCLHWASEGSSFLPLCKKSYFLHTCSYENHNFSHVIRMWMCLTLGNGHILK